MARERLLAQAHELWPAVGHGVPRGDERPLVLRATPGPKSRALAAEVGVIDLHPAVELSAVFTHAHHIHELVLHEPGGLVAPPHMAHQFERRDVVLGLGQQMQGSEPARKP